MSTTTTEAPARIELVPETEVGRFYVTLDGRMNVGDGLRPIGPAIVSVVVNQVRRPADGEHATKRANVSVRIDGRHQYGNPASHATDDEGVADLERFLSKNFVGIVADPSFVPPVVVTSTVNAYEGPLLFGVDQDRDVFVAESNDYDEALARAMSYSDEVGLSDGTDRPATSVVEVIELDPFAPRCGHCGELVADEEGIVVCPVCERETFALRTDRDSVDVRMTLAQWETASEDLVDSLRGFDVNLTSVRGDVVRIVSVK